MVHALLSSLSSHSQPRAAYGIWAMVLTCTLALLGCRPPQAETKRAAAAACPEPGTNDASAGSLDNTGIPSFQQYSVSDYFQGMPAAIDLTSHPDSARFAGQLRAKLDQGPNFAGHYRLVSWGCGTHCTALMLVDLRSGAVHDGVVAELGLHFRVDSALLIVNPRPEEYFEIGEVPPWAATRYYRWHQDRMELLGPYFHASAVTPPLPQAR